MLVGSGQDGNVFEPYAVVGAQGVDAFGNVAGLVYRRLRNRTFRFRAPFAVRRHHALFDSHFVEGDQLVRRLDDLRGAPVVFGQDALI